MNRNSTVIGIGAVIAALVLILGCGALFATGLGMRSMMAGGYGFPGMHLSGAMHPGGLIVVSLVWAVVIAIVAGLVAWLLGKTRPASNTAGTASSPMPAPANLPSANVDTPIGVLRMRYARGEITKEQYDTMRKDIE